MSDISNAYANALLADATYVGELVAGLTPKVIPSL